MKKFYFNLIILFVFSTANSFSQNFKTIYTSETSHFSTHIPYTTGATTIFNTISIDSSAAKPTGSELYNFVSLQNDLFSQCDTASRSTWIANAIFQNTNGDEYFLNRNNDTIFIFSQAPLGATWHLYTYANGDYLLASVNNLTTQPVLGLIDDVKTIQLTAKNSSGNTIPSDFNGKQIKLSRNYGFVQTFGYRNFPSDTAIYFLAGLDSAIVGVQNLTPIQIFDSIANVGDEFHRHGFQKNVITYTVEEFAVNKIIAKWFSPNQDTVYYSNERCYKRITYNFPNVSIITFHDTVISSACLFPYNLYYIDVYNFTNELFDTTTQSLSNKGYLTFHSDTCYTSRLKKTTHNYLYYDSFNSCYTPLIGSGVYPDYTYATGLGMVLYRDYSCFYDCYDSLVYFKKGTEVWGHPLNCSTLLSTESHTSIQNTITISPNPANSFLTLNFSSPPTGKIKLTDVLGNTVLEKQISAVVDEIKLSVEKLSAGIYFVTIESETGFKPVKFYKL